ncbi:2-oxo-4-hydroxy-4-carboxy-5-ureidoimidazoline decarboxylase [Sporolactobacillus sp. THM19-2]|uniref:2-oxo-4-hydroxy-4-carboxy-5-ureidoimidazoline decarboxylase n=1 Tax=Sporolactobacillus sp. THM19-2 TaxID=2511171 RepID=UPI0010201A62|nr:2-oxo-4-hydroxy-4-carboxy-5-ureidoimidazoline decarboxylase [Sporolactobacillus sp. THM19-2]RYL88541.1 2-oxo-4-hydroxy-4-carboxy-5-ureidoimidazoline decarboxylase [Sporolactobacillus sp. THM19-2]
MDITACNQMDEEAFVRMLGGVFEKSPWVARAVSGKRPFRSADDLFSALAAAVRGASPAGRRALINHHPRLGGSGKMTAQSVNEQKRAGLSQLEKKEAADMAALNAAYEQRFGFPFILAVRGKKKQEILTDMRQRLTHTQAVEFTTAVEEIIKIARFRFDDLFDPERGHTRNRNGA